MEARTARVAPASAPSSDGGGGQARAFAAAAWSRATACASRLSLRGVAAHLSPPSPSAAPQRRAAAAARTLGAAALRGSRRPARQPASPPRLLAAPPSRPSPRRRSHFAFSDGPFCLAARLRAASPSLRRRGSGRRASPSRRNQASPSPPHHDACSLRLRPMARSRASPSAAAAAFAGGAARPSPSPPLRQPSRCFASASGAPSRRLACALRQAFSAQRFAGGPRPRPPPPAAFLAFASVSPSLPPRARPSPRPCPRARPSQSAREGRASSPARDSGRPPRRARTPPRIRPPRHASCGLRALGLEAPPAPPCAPRRQVSGRLLASPARILSARRRRGGAGSPARGALHARRPAPGAGRPPVRRLAMTSSRALASWSTWTP